MIVKPRIRGFVCITAHPEGCAAKVAEEIAVAKAASAPENGPKHVLVIGSSTGYGLSTRIAAAFGYQAATLGVFFERPSLKGKPASAGWYNSVAFEKAAHAEGLYAKSINGDAFSNEIKAQTIEAIKAEALKQENQLVREKSQLIVLKQHLTAEEVLLLDIHNQLQDIKTAIDDSFITAQWDGWVRDIKVRSGSEVMKNEVVMTLQGHHYDLHAPLSIERYKKLSHIKNIAGYINVSGVEHALTQGALVPYKMHKQPEVSWSLPEDKKWIAGERFDVFIRIPHDELTTKLPQKAVFDSYVFEIVEGRLRAVPVTIMDVSEQGQSEVLVSGLTENMHIMTTGLAGPKEGLAVKVSE